MKIDWTKSMNQTFEYYEIDPISWTDKKLLKNIKSCSISMNNDAETLGSASIETTEIMDEMYIRIYLIATQNNITEKVPLGVFLIQTPSVSFDGKVASVSIDAYTPLLELKENQPPLGYALLKGDNIMNEAYTIIRDNCRVPVIKTESTKTLNKDFIANTSDKWIRFITDLIAQAQYHLYLDEMGRILFAPDQKISELQPVWTFNDDNSSILLPDISLEHDIYGIPNVVEVVANVNNQIYISRVVNDDPNSPTSTIRRGREITYRDTQPTLSGYPSQEMVDEYAENLLKNLSAVQYKVSYTHGYCPVRVGDCVRLNYKNAGFDDVKAKVISQNINCDSGCSVSEQAVFTKNLWK